MAEEIKPEIKEELTLLEQTQATVKELREQLDRKDKQIAEEQRMKSNELLSGRSAAGNTMVVDPEQVKKERIKNYWKGTIVESYLK